jgi:hypothetical protein
MIAVAHIAVALWLFGDPPQAAPPPEPAPAPAEPTEAPAPASTEPSEPQPPPIDPAQIDALLAGMPGPSLRELQDAALRRAAIDPHAPARWLRRTRVAAALPAVSVQVDQRLDRGWTLDREVGQSDALRNDAGSQAVVRAKASWELDRLLYSPEELRVTRAALDLADARERVLVEVTALYFERQRLLLERALVPLTDLDAAIASAVRLREVEGLLTGLTGIEFAMAAPR